MSPDWDLYESLLSTALGIAADEPPPDWRGVFQPTFHDDASITIRGRELIVAQLRPGVRVQIMELIGARGRAPARPSAAGRAGPLSPLITSAGAQKSLPVAPAARIASAVESLSIDNRYCTGCDTLSARAASGAWTRPARWSGSPSATAALAPLARSAARTARGGAGVTRPRGRAGDAGRAGGARCGVTARARHGGQNCSYRTL